jgi:serine/threonine protein kinase
MGVVYQAQRVAPDHADIFPGTIVALKVVIPDQPVNERDQARFKREAELCQILRHPHIVAVLDSCNFYDEVLWFAMEYVAGQDGAKLAPFPLDEALTIADQILAALDYAHQVEIPGVIGQEKVIQHGVVHRDIKPSNIMVTRTGATLQAKLTDFGLAKAYQFAGQSNFTETGEFKGTMAYLSPDQLLDYRYAKPAADIYSFGATLYTLLTGEIPYLSKGLNMLDILEARILPLQHHTPFPDQHDPHRWAAVAKIIETAMKKEPENRYPSAAVMRAALAKIR